MVEFSELLRYLNQLLKPADFDDYCPNGLQVEGRPTVHRLVTGVTASQALIEKAIEFEADAVLVHHGYFWKGEPAVVTGMKRQRLRRLLQHDINLLAYHLPLDAHPLYGNNAQLAALLNIRVDRERAEKGNGLLWSGTLPDAFTAGDFTEYLQEKLGGRPPLHIGDQQRNISTIAWCTGGGQGLIEAACELGVDVFLTGEASEQTTHVARERGIEFFAAGHHATERGGVKALGEHLADVYSIDSQFIDIDNPV